MEGERLSDFSERTSNDRNVQGPDSYLNDFQLVESNVKAFADIVAIKCVTDGLK